MGASIPNAKTVVAAPRLRDLLARQFIVAALVPLLLTFGGYFYFLNLTLENHVDAENRSVAASLTAQVEQMLSAASFTVTSIAGLLDVDERFAGHEDVLLDQHVHQDGIFEAIYLLDPDGKVQHVGLPPERRLSRRNSVGLHYGHRNFVQEAMRSRQPTWSDSFLSVTSGKTSVAYAVPVGSRTLVGELNLHKLANQLQEISVYVGTRATIVDARGNIIASPDVLAGAQQANLGHHLLLNDAQKNSDSILQFTIAGQKHLGRVATIKETQWQVFATQREEHAFAALNALTHILLAASVLAIVLSVFMGIVFSRWFANRFGTIVEDVDIITQGNFQLPERTYALREFAQVGHGLRVMADTLRAGRDHLEEQVVERTHALAGALQQAQAANRAKSVFLSNMSHELRTPLNAVIGLSRLMVKSAHLSEKDRGNLETINSSGTHLLSLINDVLELSKIESGRQELQEQEVDLPGLIREVAGMLRPRAEEAGLQFVVNVRDLPAMVRIDAVKLRQILINLLGNAIKFTPQGRVSLDVIGSPPEEQRVRVEFVVSDSGVGIPAAEHQRIFEPFVQLVTHATQSGTGLGLTITRQYLHMLGSELALDSTPGKGTTFRFVLTLSLASAAADVLPRCADNALDSELDALEQALRAKHAGARLLLAEDNPTNREIALEWLHAAALNVDTAADGLEAIEMVRQNPYDLILMDMRMPRLDGVAATQAIRTLPDAAAIPIVAMTANVFEEHRRECFAAGMNDFIAKPVDAALLYATLLKWLKPASRPADAGPAVERKIAATIDSTLLERLGQLPGVDVATGVANLRGKADRYLDLLGKFVSSHCDDMDQFEGFLAANDLDKGHLIAHSLKGASATLGLNEIAVCARRIDERMRESAGAAPDPSLMADDVATIRRALAVLLRELRAEKVDAGETAA